MNNNNNVQRKRKRKRKRKKEKGKRKKEKGKRKKRRKYSWKFFWSSSSSKNNMKWSRSACDVFISHAGNALTFEFSKSLWRKNDLFQPSNQEKKRKERNKAYSHFFRDGIFWQWRILTLFQSHSRTWQQIHLTLDFNFIQLGKCDWWSRAECSIQRGKKKKGKRKWARCCHNNACKRYWCHVLFASFSPCDFFNIRSVWEATFIQFDCCIRSTFSGFIHQREENIHL